jgi:hypothetical protein
MTSETRTTIQLSDFKAVEFECRECRCRIVRPMGAIQPALLACPECGNTWAVWRGAMEFFTKTISQIPKAAVIDQDESHAPVIVRFEINTDKKP